MAQIVNGGVKPEDPALSRNGIEWESHTYSAKFKTEDPGPRLPALTSQILHLVLVDLDLNWIGIGLLFGASQPW